MAGRVVATYDGRKLQVSGRIKKLIKNQNVYRPELPKEEKKNAGKNRKRK